MAMPSPIEFTANTDAVAADVNSNFDAIKSYVDTYCILKDASLAFTSVPSGPSTDPVAANDFTRKAYVDALRNAYSGEMTFTSTPASVTVATSPAFTSLATVDSGTAIPVNATASDLVLEATASVEYSGGNGNSTILTTLEVSFDNGATWETAARQNSACLLVAPETAAYGSVTIIKIAKKAYASPYIVKARLLATQRASFSTAFTAQYINLALTVRRQAALA
jgi:hypothetical protein